MVTRLLYNSIIDKVELMDIIVELLVECLQIEFRMLFDLAVVEIVSSERKTIQDRTLFRKDVLSHHGIREVVDCVDR